MRTLTLPLKGVYFDAIKLGEKLEEYRLCTEFWRKRLEGREFDQVVLTRGYPPQADQARRLVRAWRGFTVRENFVHPHFGPDPVTVFAIDVSEPAA